MLTMADIDTLTNSHDGSVFSDLYKDVYGFRPRNVLFESLDDFDKQFTELAEELNKVQALKEVQQDKNFKSFEKQVADTMEIVVNCDTARAVRMVALAEGVTPEELEFYGWESLEYRLDIPYGSISKYLENNQ